MDKRTPGPWKVRRNIIYVDWFSPNGEEYDKYIARVDPDVQAETYAEMKANAEFIVRACNSHDELLAACKASFEFVDSIAGISPVDIPNENELWLQLQAAIASAREE